MTRAYHTGRWAGYCKSERQCSTVSFWGCAYLRSHNLLPSALPYLTSTNQGKRLIQWRFRKFCTKYSVRPTYKGSRTNLSKEKCMWNAPSGPPVAGQQWGRSARGGGGKKVKYQWPYGVKKPPKATKKLRAEPQIRSALSFENCTPTKNRGKNAVSF